MGCVRFVRRERTLRRFAMYDLPPSQVHRYDQSDLLNFYDAPPERTISPHKKKRKGRKGDGARAKRTCDAPKESVVWLAQLLEPAGETGGGPTDDAPSLWGTGAEGNDDWPVQAIVENDEEVHGYDMFEEMVLASCAGFYQIADRVCVVQGWDAMREEANVSVG